ncbi:unnamed protein product [Gordionus sp. m RMFG-2023]
MKDASIAYFKSQNPSITNATLIDMGAQAAYENGVRLFMESTLKKAIALRPYAKWGYYGYPSCARDLATGYFCDEKQQRLNEQKNWIFVNSLGLYPNLYLNSQILPDPDLRAIYILKRMNEAMRMSRFVIANNMPIYPYIRYQYEQQPIPSYLSQVDMENSIGQAIDTGLSGIVHNNYLFIDF